MTRGIISVCGCGTANICGSACPRPMVFGPIVPGGVDGESFADFCKRMLTSVGRWPAAYPLPDGAVWAGDCWVVGRSSYVPSALKNYASEPGEFLHDPGVYP